MQKMPPNLIWFMVDQMRNQAMGCHGNPDVFTPNLDNLAIAGTDFPQAVSGVPLCCPFRGSMLTSRYAHNHTVKLHEDRLDPVLPTVVDEFNRHGYETIYFGKWHLAGIKESEGRSALRTVPREDRGRFDTWLGYDNNNSPWDSYLHGHDGAREVAHYRMPGYETDVLTDMALERICNRPSSAPPFFMVVSVQPPHVPNLAPSNNRRYQARHLTLRPNVPNALESSVRTGLAGYYGQIENIDDNVGRLIDGLRQANMLDDTQILFFADHGDQMGSQGRFGKCVPFEESIRVPFLVGGGVPMSYDGRKSGAAPCLVNHVDIAPTSLGLCGLDIPDWMQGFDYSHRRTGLDFEQRVAQEPDSAYLQLIGDRESGYAWRCVVTRDGWKYACVKNGEWVLFDLNNDPFEQNNLAFNTALRAKRRQMNELIRQWAGKTGDSFDFPAD